MGARRHSAPLLPRRGAGQRRTLAAGAYRKHAVEYSIGEDAGFAGADWGVEWCVTGYDLNWAYNPRCKMAGP